MKKWTSSETEWLICNYPIHGKQYCMEILNRTEGSIRRKATDLKLAVQDPGVAQRRNAFERYKSWIETTEYELLDSFDMYKGNQSKLLTRHTSCGYEWRLSPNNASRLVGCPNCSKSGFKATRETFLYYIYFPALDLYKVGITVDWDKRKYDFGYTPELLSLIPFSSGTEAKEAEEVLLTKLSVYMANTGELKAGNTETFIWPERCAETA